MTSEIVGIALRASLVLCCALAVPVTLLLPRAPDDPPSVTALIDRRLADEPHVVVLGNSVARRSVRAEYLSELLGSTAAEPIRCANLARAGTSPASWYAVLEHRVFGQGHRPWVVIVAAPQPGLEMTEPASPRELADLVRIAGTSDPTLVGKLAGPTPWDRLRFVTRARRAILATSTVDAIAERLPEALFGPVPGANTDLWLRVDASGVGDAPTTDDIEATFVPELWALARASRVRIVFVRVPMRPTLGQPPTRATAMVRYADERGIPYVDGLGLGIGQEHYLDKFHVDPAGARAFTEELAVALRGAYPFLR